MSLPSRSVVLSLAIGFLFGVGAGWLSFPRLHHHRTPQEHYQHVLKRFDAELKLNADQHAKVAAIMEGSRAQIEEMRSDMEPRFDRIHKTMVTEVRKVLDADQQKKLDAIEARFAEWRKTHPNPWGPQ